MNKLDPFFWLSRIMHSSFMDAELNDQERAFIGENIQKHRKIFWLTFLVGVMVYV